MRDAPALVPAPMAAAALPFKRLGAAFGRRFFLLLLLGLGWLIPAIVEHRFVYAMLAWDVLVLLAWLADLARMPRPSQLSVHRSWRDPVSLSVVSQVDLKLVNDSRSTVYGRILDNVPSQLRAEPPQVEIRAGRRSQAEQSYGIFPVQRGEARLGDAYLRYQSSLRLAERWARVALAQNVRVYPNLDEAKRFTIYLVRSRQIDLEKRYVRTRGAGRSFDSLREYRQGDEFRDICWTASARRAKLVTRTYQVERSQTIWLVLDCGRLMRTRIGQLSKLDYAVNAALSIAQVALYSGDRVGLLAYARHSTQRVPAARGSSHLRQLIEQLAMIREDVSEGDHLQLASRLLTDQKRRSLIIWLTDLAETSMTPEVIEAAALMMPRHLVLFAVIGQPDLAEMAARNPENVEEMYQSAAAQEVVHRREMLLARLRERGALALEVSAASLSLALVNSYLEIKEKSRL